MSCTMHLQSAKYASCFLHSAHAAALVNSGWPAPLGLLPPRKDFLDCVCTRE